MAETDFSRTVKKVVRAMLSLTLAHPSHQYRLLNKYHFDYRNFKKHAGGRNMFIMGEAYKEPGPVLAILSSFFPNSCQLYLGTFIKSSLTLGATARR